MVTEVIFDIETKKLFNEISTANPADLGVSIVSVYRRELDESLREITGIMQSFWESDLAAMWPLFVGVDRIIGFNSLKFDVPALKPYAPYNLTKLPHFDILSVVRQTLGRNISLKVLAKDTLGHTKIDVGTNAVLYWNNGDKESLAKLKKYCEMDVQITKELYDYGMKHKHVKFTDPWNTVKTLPIDFSYPRDQLKQTKQIGLF